MTDLAAVLTKLESIEHAVLGHRLSRSEVAERVGKDVATITRWVRSGKFPAPRGGYWMLADVVAWERNSKTNYLRKDD